MIHSFWRLIIESKRKSISQYHWFIETDICERPVHYYEIRIVNLCAHLQQTEHGTLVQL